MSVNADWVAILELQNRMKRYAEVIGAPPEAADVAVVSFQYLSGADSRELAEIRGLVRLQSASQKRYSGPEGIRGWTRNFPSRGQTVMSWDQVEGKWKQVKGSAREKWGKFTDDDLEVISGKRDKLVGKLQERYGLLRDQAEKQADEWCSGATLEQRRAERVARRTA